MDVSDLYLSSQITSTSKTSCRLAESQFKMGCLQSCIQSIIQMLTHNIRCSKTNINGCIRPIFIFPDHINKQNITWTSREPIQNGLFTEWYTEHNANTNSQYQMFQNQYQWMYQTYIYPLISHQQARHHVD